MGKKNLRKVVNLSRLMTYMLGTRPDEFGLVPDTDGYIPLKEVLKAISEEPGSGYVRESHVKEVLLHDTDGVFEMSEKKIRSRKRTFAPVDKERDAGPPSSVLFKGVKRKAYPFILRAGLLRGSQEHVVLTTDKDVAIRIARRLEQTPIMLEIRAGDAHENGIAFYPFGESLYLADEIPIQFISGPPLPKERQSKEAPQRSGKEMPTGSFILTSERDPDLRRRAKTKKRIEWKDEGKQRRRKKDWR
ncbi:MAG TPA: RNA 2'-phosphotransferase [Desulfatiglandales bacterium]|nr:RNA 2'-phosphotransferase [Desulfatiglandales bacterium]